MVSTQLHALCEEIFVALARHPDLYRLWVHADDLYRAAVERGL